MLGRGTVTALAAEHAPDLRDHALAVEALDAGHRLLACEVLFEPEVDVGEGGDLRQVGDAEHLPFAPQRLQPLADDPGGLAADAGVDLVEDHGPRARRLTEAAEGQ